VIIILIVFFMPDIVYIYHLIYLQHDTGFGHPERPERLQAIENTIKKKSIVNNIEFIEAQKAGDKEISLIHTNSYILEVKNAIKDKRWILDGGDTVISEHSVDAAYFAAGSAISGVNLLHTGNTRRVFCALRPPGHHAEKDRAMGFCIFNNVAVAARYAQNAGFEKILIIDWDVHHGNGTQHIFEKDNTVFYYSLHQYPYYPGTGSESEKGVGDGEGFTLNRPLPAGCSDHEYIEALNKDLQEIEQRFRADLVIISAGFDAHKDDPLANMLVTEQGYKQMTIIVGNYANKYAQGRILSVLEGGYNLSALSESVFAHLEGLIVH
jgi:acetoin utilization deacetylase AcuC-like enzyme